uniref:Uncharacterized protein n=1 Tax=Hyaloperonospora arabidopsidis (strain Emoy2) TaxID=559515 RepID=M4C3L9_HYAAE
MRGDLLSSCCNNSPNTSYFKRHDTAVHQVVLSIAVDVALTLPNFLNRTYPSASLCVFVNYAARCTLHVLSAI